MLLPGFVSVTFRKLTPREWVELARETGLKAVEWGGDIHVPHGDIATAREVARMSIDAGLHVAAYGSYFRVGTSEAQGLSFASVLETAVALGAPGIRVWCCKQSSADIDADGWKGAVDESRRIAEAAQAAGLWVAYEFHDRTLNDNPASCLKLLQDVGHPNLRTYWQPDIGKPPAQNRAAANIDGLKRILPYLTHLHAYYNAQGEDGALRQTALDEGMDFWREIVEIVRQSAADRCLLLEFAMNGDIEIFRRDARTLRGLLSE